MPVALASELWSELKRYVSTVDRDEAAETVVNILIDNDIDVEEIKANFKGDPDIRRALQSFLDDAGEDPEEEDEEFEEDY